MAEHATCYPCTTKQRKIAWCAKSFSATSAREKHQKLPKYWHRQAQPRRPGASGTADWCALIKNIEPVLHRQGSHLQNLKTLGRLPRLAQ